MVGKTYSITASDITIQMLYDGDVIGPIVQQNGHFEPESLAFWSKIVKYCGKVLDIGAYSGIYGIIAAKAGCKVLAFEPMPNQYQRVLDNAKLNNCSIIVRNECVSDRNDHALLQYNARMTALTSGASIKTPVAGTVFQSMVVKSLTIDSLNLTDCSAMKIDVEGAEPEVLIGARKTIKKHQPIILAEALTDTAGEAMLEAVPDYKLAMVLDGRNWVMVPKCLNLSTSGYILD
jgi:FkbM family methyltransferase